MRQVGGKRQNGRLIMNKTFMVRLPVRWQADVNEIAEANQCSATEIVRRALRQYLDTYRSYSNGDGITDGSIDDPENRRTQRPAVVAPFDVRPVD